MSSIIVATGVKGREDAAYGSCGYGRQSTPSCSDGRIETRSDAEGLAGGLLDQLKAVNANQITGIRRNLHLGGHLDLSSAELSRGDAGIKIVGDLDAGYRGVVQSVVGIQPGGANLLGLSAEDGSTAAMVQRIVQVGLIQQVGEKGIPDLSQAEEDLIGMLGFHNEEEAGLMLAQVMTIFKAGDIQTSGKPVPDEWPLTLQILNKVFDLADARFQQETPSPVRYYGVSSWVHRYDHVFCNDYLTMVCCGDLREVDLTLHALGRFIEGAKGTNPLPGVSDQEIREWVPSYLSALEYLAEGTNTNTPVTHLNSPSDFGGNVLSKFKLIGGELAVLAGRSGPLNFAGASL